MSSDVRPLHSGCKAAHPRGLISRSCVMHADGDALFMQRWRSWCGGREAPLRGPSTSPLSMCS